MERASVQGSGIRFPLAYIHLASLQGMPRRMDNPAGSLAHLHDDL